jgi:hypothetical protein
MPVDVAMYDPTIRFVNLGVDLVIVSMMNSPRTRVVRPEPDSHGIGGITATGNNVATRRVHEVGGSAGRTLYEV